MQLLTVKDVAQKWKVSDKLLYKQIKEGTIRIPFVRIGSCIRFKESDVDRYIDNKTGFPKRRA